MVFAEGPTKREQRELALPERLRLESLEEMIVDQDIELAERVTLARMVEFGKMDRREEDQRARLTKYRPRVPNFRRGR